MGRERISQTDLQAAYASRSTANRSPGSCRTFPLSSRTFLTIME
jgi:hypothetical protein